MKGVLLFGQRVEDTGGWTGRAIGRGGGVAPGEGAGMLEHSNAGETNATKHAFAAAGGKCTHCRHSCTIYDHRPSHPNNAGTERFAGRGGGGEGYSLVATLSYIDMDRASIPRQGLAVPTPDRGTSNISAPVLFFVLVYHTQKKRTIVPVVVAPGEGTASCWWGARSVFPMEKIGRVNPFRAH